MGAVIVSPFVTSILHSANIYSVCLSHLESSQYFVRNLSCGLALPEIDGNVVSRHGLGRDIWNNSFDDIQYILYVSQFYHNVPSNAH